MPIVRFVRTLVPGQLDFIRVYYDDVVTHVHMWSEARFVLAAKADRNIRCQPTQNYILGVD